MGLDMYLEVRRFVPAYNYTNSERIPNETYAIVGTAGLDKVVAPDAVGATVSATAIYWRKVNSIHNWFVNECADGRDECQEIYVGRNKLTELRDTVEMVLKSKNNAVAQEHLPTAAGFFFGSQDYDEYYWSDLEYTLTELDRVLRDADEDIDFYYQASW